MGCGLIACRENAGALHRDVDTHFAMRKFGRVLDRGHFDRSIADIDRIACNGHLGREAAVDAVETQKVGVGFDRPQIVDGDDLNIRAAAFDDGAQYVASDASKTVDRDLHCHFSRPFDIARRIRIESGVAWRARKSRVYVRGGALMRRH
jgi:hypothetical protein